MNFSIPGSAKVPGFLMVAFPVKDWYDRCVFSEKVFDAWMRMRLLVGIILCIAAMLFVNAYAGTDGDIRCWTANADPDYHMDKNRRDAEMFPISEKSAVAFGKKACADCVESEEKTVLNDADGVWMAHRGGTYLLCIPYETVEGTASFKTEESPETRAYTGEEAEKQLAGMVAPTA